MEEVFVDYPFENLGPEDFQRFCQGLLARTFPKVMCFPVAQPDGGRDAIVFTGAGMRDFIVYQIKFVRNPSAMESPHKWLIDIVKEESPKLAKLIPKGAVEFVLITNVPGTAHPGVGSIDTLDKILQENIPIRSAVWWRDDIARRLDVTADLRWAYPQLLTATDLIKGLIESGLGEDKERRAAAVKAFLSDQYAIDQQVRFKQVELHNRLLDLFIDVPIAHSDWSSRHVVAGSGTLRIAYRSVSHRATGMPSAENYYAHTMDRTSIGGATLLLDEAVQGSLQFIVLEGAPGQGKSTITQYVAQVHRMRLLSKHEDIDRISPQHRTSGLRLPIKADLRDYATWLGRKDPFAPEAVDVPEGWSKSLESFLAALIRHHSGGASFDVSDLHATFKTSPTVVLLDGLDEIADIDRRGEVVNEIVTSARRLRDVALAFQVVVTSRPSAFTSSIGLPDEIFRYFQLGDVTRPLIDLYADKWVTAKQLKGAEGADVKRVLAQKLDQPHLRDLARNPMQLAILLTLIHTRGASLPDKRTALYDSYVDLFFSREAEKSEIVRDNRDMLIDIHRYLGWTLHSEAQVSGTNGAIGADALLKLVREYLVGEGHDAALADDLFRGMVERVVALVSRIEGSFEFEVQPLREYFAARHLYETAPYSPTGGERGGTKPDRLDALLRDFYWLNVARFFAGCFSKGELRSLVDRLQELAKDANYALTAHPRVVAATLLNDWVFSQHPRSVEDMVALLLDGVGLRLLMSTKRRRLGGGFELVLPPKSGREQLVERCFGLLGRELPPDFAYDVIDVIRSNAAADDVCERWISQVRGSDEKSRSRCFHYGVHLGAVGRIPRAKLEELLKLGQCGTGECLALMSAQRWDVLSQRSEWIERCADLILDGVADNQARSRPPATTLDRLSWALHPGRYGMAFSAPDVTSLSELLKRRGVGDLDGQMEVASGPIGGHPELADLTSRAIAFCREAELLGSLPAMSWATSSDPWEKLTEAGTKYWGARWSVRVLAALGAARRLSKADVSEDVDLSDSSLTLVRRARQSRLRAGNQGWWKRQIEMSSAEDELLWVLLLFICWAGPKAIVHVAGLVDQRINELSARGWGKLHAAGRACINTFRNASDRTSRRVTGLVPAHLSPRTVCLLGLRATPEWDFSVLRSHLAEYQGDDEPVSQYCQETALLMLSQSTDHADFALSVIRRSYALRAVASESFLWHAANWRERLPSLETARQIMRDPERFPALLVGLAERQCHAEISTRIEPVGKVAARERWTFAR